MPDLSEAPWDDAARIVSEFALPVLTIVVVAVIAVRLARLFVHGLVKTLLDRETSEGTAQELSAIELKKRMDTLDQLGSRVVQSFIVVIAGLMLLGELGLNIGPAIAGLGVVGIAVGFGAQTLVRDYLTGALILIENQYAKGDIVRIAGVAGVVEDFNLRRTTLRDLDGIVHTVPNGEVTVASNMTRVWARINLDVTVAYGTDMDRVFEVVAAVGREMAADEEWRRRILEPPVVLRVNELADSGVTLKIVGSTRAAEQWAVGGEFRKRLLVAFEANGIRIPYPHRVIVPAPSRPATEDTLAERHDADATAEASD
jgi:moderate conductance mechanosensitive channel